MIDQDNFKSFKTAKEFGTWLEKYHNIESELWMKIYKKSAPQSSINWQEAVVVALCWGWIDGVKKSLDDQAYLQRFTPRRKGSNWSKINTEHVEKLIKKGLMKPHGLAHVEAAKADGRWAAAYAPVSQMVISADFLEALDSNIKAKKFFHTLNKTSKYTIAYGLQTAKKTETRKRRFDKYITMLENNVKP